MERTMLTTQRLLLKFFIFINHLRRICFAVSNPCCDVNSSTYFLFRICIEIKKLDEKSEIDIDIFKTFARTHQALLFPVFNLQHQLQVSVLGSAFWERASGRRIEISKGHYVTLSELMQVVSCNLIIVFCVLCIVHNNDMLCVN